MKILRCWMFPAAIVTAFSGLSVAQPSNPVAAEMTGSEATDADLVTYPTLCTGEDWVVFNATSDASGKIVSICMTEGDDSTPSHLTYRFGRPGAVELIYPPSGADWSEKFTFRRYTRPRTTYLKFEFTNDEHNYEILDGGDDEGAYTGLRVVRVDDGEILTEQQLTPATEPLSLMQLEDLVRTEPFDE